ncbi:MAG TPA: hypothetical protein VF789_06845 [Thermoanaerobaculia bacterium]
MPAERPSTDHALRPGAQVEEDKPERFWKWFRKNEPKVTVIIVVLSTLFHIEEIVRAMVRSVYEPWFPSLCYGIHLFVILVLFFYVRGIEQPKSTAYPEANAVSLKFLKCLYALLIGWAMLYAAMAIRSVESLEDKDKLIAQACQVSQSAQSISGGAQTHGWSEKDARSLVHALQLAERYQSRCKKQGQTSQLEDALNTFEQGETAAGLGAWEIPIVLLNILQSIPLFLLFWTMKPPGDESNRIATMLMIVVIVIFAAVMLNMKEPGALEYLGSLFGAIALALWAARLSSVYLQISTPAITCLLLYAILQLSGATFRQESDVFLIVTQAMMLLKVFTVFVCVWLIDTRRLLYYFAELRQLHGLDTQTPIVGVSIDERFRYFIATVDAKGQTLAATLTQGPRPSTESAESHSPAEPQVSIALIKVPASALKIFLDRLGFGGLMPRAVTEPTSSSAEPKVVTGSTTTAPQALEADYPESNSEG